MRGRWSFLLWSKGSQEQDQGTGSGAGTSVLPSLRSPVYNTQTGALPQSISTPQELSSVLCGDTEGWDGGGRMGGRLTMEGMRAGPGFTPFNEDINGPRLAVPSSVQEASPLPAG